MKIAAIIARTLLGLGFIIFGLNILHPFMPMPPLSGPPADFFNAVAVETHFMLVIGFFQVLGGLLALSGRFTPLGLTTLAGLLINIITYHLTFHVPGVGIGVIFGLLEIFCIWTYRANFAGIFSSATSV
ncbi:MAG TPA: DoxX family protein [Acidobacteriaceae bacterium]